MKVCMSYFNVWAEVVFCGFPQRRCVYFLHITNLYHPTKFHVLCIGVIKFNQKKKMMNKKKRRKRKKRKMAIPDCGQNEFILT